METASFERVKLHALVMQYKLKSSGLIEDIFLLDSRVASTIVYLSDMQG